MVTDIRCKIITGRYPKTDEESQEFLEYLFGANAEYRYELYFHWYNLIHELGHAIMAFNNPERPHPAEEEQLVNDFAVAYWRQYGETAKLWQLEELVTQTMTKFPALTDGDYLEFTKVHWGEDVFKTFEGYGWFQFNSVQKSLSRKRTLEEALGSLCPGSIKTKESFLMKSMRKWQKWWCQMLSTFCGNGACPCLREFQLYYLMM